MLYAPEESSGKNRSGSHGSMIAWASRVDAGAGCGLWPQIVQWSTVVPTRDECGRVEGGGSGGHVCVGLGGWNGSSR